MGGSSSKKEKKENNNEEKNEKTGINEKIYIKQDNIIKDKENNMNIINIIDNNKKDEEKKENKKKEEELFDGIEELTLEQNGILTRNENQINLILNPAITNELKLIKITITKI